MVDRKVCGSNAESKGIGEVVDSLDDAVAVHIGVASSDNSISSPQLLLDGVLVAVPEAVLAKIILGVVLGSSGCYGKRCRVDNRS